MGVYDASLSVEMYAMKCKDDASERQHLRGREKSWKTQQGLGRWLRVEALPAQIPGSEFRSWNPTKARQAWWLPVTQAREAEIVNWLGRLGMTAKFQVQ